MSRERGVDLSLLLGLGLAAVAVIGGHVWEGGHVNQIVQPTAFLIVIGGSFAACLVRFTLPQVRRALGDALAVVRPTDQDIDGTVQLLAEAARTARRQGLVALDKEIEKVRDPFMATALRLCADGVDARALEQALGVRIRRIKEEEIVSAQFFEQAGGYAPTIGVLGAVLGLIHVMGNITNPEALGAGVAVAFVATLYGVGAANLIFLPLGGKLKMRALERTHRLELIASAAVSIAAGENPMITEQRLMAWLHERPATPSRDASG